MKQLVSLLNLAPAKPEKGEAAPLKSKQTEADDRFQSSLDEAFQTIALHDKTGTEINAKAVVSSRQSKETLAEEKEIRDIKSIKDIQDIVRLAGEKKLGLKSLTVEIRQAGGTDKKLVIKREDTAGKQPVNIRLTTADHDTPQPPTQKNTDPAKIDLKELIAQLDKEAADPALSEEELPSKKEEKALPVQDAHKSPRSVKAETPLQNDPVTKESGKEKLSTAHSKNAKESAQEHLKELPVKKIAETQPSDNTKISPKETAVEAKTDQPKQTLPTQAMTAEAAEETGTTKDELPKQTGVKSQPIPTDTELSEESEAAAIKAKTRQSTVSQKNEVREKPVTSATPQTARSETAPVKPQSDLPSQRAVDTLSAGDAIPADKEAFPKEKTETRQSTPVHKQPNRDIPSAVTTQAVKNSRAKTESEPLTKEMSPNDGDKSVKKPQQPLRQETTSLKTNNLPHEESTLPPDQNDLPAQQDTKRQTATKHPARKEKPAANLNHLLNKQPEQATKAPADRPVQHSKKTDTKQSGDTLLNPETETTPIQKSEPAESKTAKPELTVSKTELSDPAKTLNSAKTAEKTVTPAVTDETGAVLSATEQSDKTPDTATVQKEKLVKPSATLNSLIASQKAESKESKKQAAPKAEPEIRSVQAAPSALLDLREAMPEGERELLGRMVSQNLSAPASGILKSDPLQAEIIQNGKTGTETALESISQNENGIAEETVQDVAKADDVKTDTVKNRIAAARTTINHFVADMKERIENYKAPLMKLTLDLNPKNLGSVGVTLLNRGKNLHVQIHSNNQAIQLFMQNHGDFRNALADLGYKDVQLNFSSGQGSSANHNGGGSQSGYQEQQASRYYGTENENGTESEEMEIILPNLIYG